MAVLESEHNKQIIKTWVEVYLPKVEEVTVKLANNLVENPQEVVAQIRENLLKRLSKNGVDI